MIDKIKKWISVSDASADEFSPPAIEVLEKSPSKAGQYLVWALSGLFILFIIWTFVGEIEEVAVARGKVIPVGYTKVLQAEDKGIVKQILVQEGQFVHKDELLMELDPTLSESDLNALKKEIKYHELTIERIMAELEHRPFVIPQGDYDEKDIVQQKNLYQTRTTEWKAKNAFLDAQIRQKEDNVRVANSSLRKYTELLGIAKEREAKLKEIVEIGAISKYTYLDYKGKCIELEQNVEMNHSELSAAKADAAASHQEKAEYIASWNRKLQEELIDSCKQYNACKEQERKALLKNRLVEIKSPSDGTVHKLDIHTIGAVVQPAQELMEIVPAGTKMEVEAWLENKDVGFVQQGMPVEVKVDAFNFQKFGTLNGTVREISPDAITDKERGQIYKVLVSLDATSFNKDGKELSMISGMTVSAEIKTRKKRVIDFFLEPFQTYKNEALRER